LEPGKAADLIAIKNNRLGYAGALHDLVAAIVFCSPCNVDWSMINGRVIVQQGRITTMEIEPLIERHNRIARQMVDGR
jgi:cytosine/adenosine deaminase-related metal-dependent hydrolase